MVTAGLALFFFVFFFTQTGWGDRNLPDEFGAYLAHQFGLYEIDGRVTRFGRILKQSWVAPMICLLVLMPTALWNLQSSFKEHKWRKRFLLPTSAHFELTKYAANSFLATKITFMNEIANFCELVGADVDKVRTGIGSDSRIGKRFLFSESWFKKKV